MVVVIMENVVNFMQGNLLVMKEVLPVQMVNYVVNYKLVMVNIRIELVRLVIENLFNVRKV